MKTNGPIRGISDFLFSHGASEVLSCYGVECEFDFARDAELVIDRAQIVSNRMLGECEFVADIPRA
jgi:hypothetical protein